MLLVILVPMYVFPLPGNGGSMKKCVDSGGKIIVCMPGKWDVFLIKNLNGSLVVTGHTDATRGDVVHFANAKNQGDNAIEASQFVVMGIPWLNWTRNNIDGTKIPC
jgi:hypothetical protein